MNAVHQPNIYITETSKSCVSNFEKLILGDINLRNHYFALFLFSLNHAKILDPGMFQILIKCKIGNINVILGKKWEKFPLNLGGGHEGKLRTFDPLISALFRPGGEGGAEVARRVRQEVPGSHGRQGEGHHGRVTLT